MLRERKVLSWAAWAGFFGLLIFQTWAFATRMPLSLGPRVILQPWLQRQGYVAYEDLADLHMPLMPLVLQMLGGLFENELLLARLVLVGLLALTTLLVFLLARRALGTGWGLWAAGFFVVWAPAFQAGKLWHESFMTPATLLYLFLYRPDASRRRWGWSVCLGLLGGVNLLIKQHAAVIFAAYLMWEVATALLLRRSFRRALREVITAGARAALPVLAYIAYHWLSAGSLEGFFYWTVGYNLQGIYQDLSHLGPNPAQVAMLLSCAMLLPAAAILLLRRTGQALNKNLPRLCGGLWFVLMAASLLLAYPRFGTFHLQPALPFTALLSAYALSRVLKAPGGRRWLGIGVTLAVSVYWMISAGSAYARVLDASSPQVINEYSTIEPLAQQIREVVQPSQRIFIFMDDESLSNLYYLLDSPPTTLWVFHYPWYMLDWIKQRIIADLQASPPEWVVYADEVWLPQKYAPEVDAYIWQHYQVERELEWDTAQVLLLRRK